MYLILTSPHWFALTTILTEHVHCLQLQSDNDRLSARVKLLQENAGAPVADLTLKVQENLLEEGVPKQQIEGDENGCEVYHVSH